MTRLTFSGKLEKRDRRNRGNYSILPSAVPPDISEFGVQGPEALNQSADRSRVDKLHLGTCSLAPKRRSTSAKARSSGCYLCTLPKVPWATSHSYQVKGSPYRSSSPFFLH